RFSRPRGVALGSDGALFVADTDNNRIRRVAPTGDVSTVAGSGATQIGGGGFADGPREAARFNLPRGLAVAPRGAPSAAAQENKRIRKIDRSTTVSTFAGGADAGRADGAGAQARFNGPSAIAVDRQGNLFVADTFNGLIRRISGDGQVSTYAGGGNANVL